MLTKEQLQEYGIPEAEYQKEYEKTTQYQLDQIKLNLKEAWKALGLDPYFHKICSWISRKLRNC